MADFEIDLSKDNDIEALDCPFCGKCADRIDDHRVQCGNEECGAYVKMFNIHDWNRRPNENVL